ncbi:DUF1566 domain-containing protein [bacterium]|nr:DUF1566 domain-containing protein [bacterium]
MAYIYKGEDEDYGFYYHVARDNGSSSRRFSYEQSLEAEDYYLKLQALDDQQKIMRIKEAELRKKQDEERTKRNSAPRSSTYVPPQPVTKKCAKCGASLLDDSLFCHNCGAKREKCCGEFLDAGMKFCPKCGKMTLGETMRIEQEREQEKIRKQQERIEQEREQEKIREQQERIEQEKIEQERRELEAKGFIDRGDYIELKVPIGNIRMIEKVCSSYNMNWNDAMQYAKNLRKGGFDDWRVPTKDELLKIYKIKDICGIDKNHACCWFWSSSFTTFLFILSGAWCVDFDYGYVNDYNKTNTYYVRCVR